MGFADEGYLSGELLQWRDTKRGKHPEHFRQMVEINNSLQAALPLTRTLKPTIDNFLIAGLSLRAVQSFQGSILMVERGLNTEAVTLTRSTIETLFYLRAARLKPEEFRKEFSQSHVRSTNKLFRGHINVMEQSPQLQDLVPKHVEGLEEALALLNGQGVEPADLKIFKVAQMAEMEWLYKTDYAMYSAYAHPSISALEQNWNKPDPMGLPVGVVCGPDKGEPDALPETILEITQCGLYLLNEMAELFPDQGIQDRIEQHKDLQAKLLEELAEGKP